MTDEILPEGEDGAGPPASKPITPRKASRTVAPAAKAAKAAKVAKPAKAANAKGTGSPPSRARATAARPDVERVEDVELVEEAELFEDDSDDGDESDIGPDTGAADEGDFDVIADDEERSSPSWPTQARRWVTTHLPTTLVGVVAVALAVVLILTLLALGNKNSLDSARTSALGAARADAVKLAGYDYRHLNRDFGAVVADSTPSFRRKFTQAGDALKTTLSKYHAIAVAHVVSAGLVSATTSRAVALVFLTQKVTNSTQKNSTSDRSQVEITLVRSGGRWLIDQVNLL